MNLLFTCSKSYFTTKFIPQTKLSCGQFFQGNKSWLYIGFMNSRLLCIQSRFNGSTLSICRILYMIEYKFANYTTSLRLSKIKSILPISALPSAFAAWLRGSVAPSGSVTSTLRDVLLVFW